MRRILFFVWRRFVVAIGLTENFDLHLQAFRDALLKHGAPREASFDNGEP
ncbi:MAG: hypothetical protein JNG88_09780 [Phycisphaerales bacterium]|nr:hypothetical protein [Phycisphaerales bacterium]